MTTMSSRTTTTTTSSDVSSSKSHTRRHQSSLRATNNYNSSSNTSKRRNRSHQKLKRSVLIKAAITENENDIVARSNVNDSDGKKNKNKAIVVGAGVGGLGMASRLAFNGYKVTILEQNDSVGGRCRSEQFDSGLDSIPDRPCCSCGSISRTVYRGRGDV